MKCPKCGEQLARLIASGNYICVKDGCGAWYADERAVKNDVVARKLAGKKTKDSSLDGLSEQLEELVRLVRLNTLNEVEEALDLAIKGRASKRDDTWEKRQVNNVERRVLQSMKAWIEDRKND